MNWVIIGILLGVAMTTGINSANATHVHTPTWDDCMYHAIVEHDVDNELAFNYCNRLFNMEGE